MLAKKKITWTLLTVTALGLAAYSALHHHSEPFETCFLCGKEGWLGMVGGFGFCAAIYAYQEN